MTASIQPPLPVDGVSGSNQGGREDSGAAMAIDFTGGTFGIDSRANAILGLSEGGEGREGSKDSKALGNATGGDGGGGGGGGLVSIDFQSGFAVAGGGFTVLKAESLGARGGDGGEGVTGAGTGKGGTGGRGGGGGASSVTLLAGGFSSSGTDGRGFDALSFGGDGGDGGKGRGDLGTGDGREGGDGGAGGGATVSLGAVTLTVDGDKGLAVQAYSEGGKGGSGGEGETDGGTGRAGDGGTGGEGLATAISLDGATVTADGSDAFGLQSYALGGDGGAGGEGKANEAGGGLAGDGGDGGASGTSAVTITSGTLNVTGDGGLALQAFSLAGDGGAGGEGSSATGVSAGGAGGAGGAAAVASLSVDTATVTTGTGSGRMLEVASVGGTAGDGGSANTSTTAGGSTSGNGGEGGASSGVAVSFGGGTFTHAGTDQLLLAESVGGAGGDGEEGENTGANGTGGKGGDGGSGGLATLALDGGTFMVGSNGGSVLVVKSRGGAAGDGGEGRTNFASSRAQGGDGGKGGDGGEVTVTSMSPGVNIAAASTTETQHGLRVESIAGGGGDGGEGDAKVFGDGFGGDGGQGGSGGEVTVDLLASVTTAGPQSQGIFARSYGGDGGNGGDGNADAGKGKGGSAAGSGPAAAASVTFSGDVTTSGDEANAVIVQSVGGFSGDAGSSSGFVAYGAGSESAGAGNTVTVSLESGSEIETKGASATAVLAQSVGGGGGRGSSGAGIVALGGAGSAGGDGGLVTLTMAGATVTTEGQGSRALHAASRGGGGGDGGAAAGIASLGGSAGSGGSGDTVTLTNSADLSTLGDQADAVYAASLGGGGGSAHSTVGLLAFGGSGGSGGDGGAVLGNSSGTIATAGADADGLFLSSIGGGGGDGSSATSVSAGLSIAIGGSGGDGGSGGMVTFDDQGATDYAVKTVGERSRGLLAKSVGGGGGDGGFAVAASASPLFDISLGGSGDGGKAGAGGAVSVTTGADIATEGSNAGALVAHSVGGGGGSAGTTVSSANAAVGVTLAVGGKGSGGGDGGAVAVTATGDLSTKGDVSAGLSTYSHGGGGGTGGTTVAGSAVDGVSLGSAIGGSGGPGGSAGTVTVGGSGTIETQGDVSPGLYAHSVGGGGGAAGTSVAATAVSSVSVDVGVGGSGGDGGDADAVTVEVDRQITTQGDISPGLTARSAGGGGGHSGATVSGSLTSEMTVNATVGGSGGSGGDAGAVTVSSLDAISTEGHSSDAVVAHSVGGGGGASHFSGAFSGESSGSVNTTVGGSGGVAGDGQTVMVSTAGALSTKGHNASAISAMSVGGGGGDSGATVSGALASGTSVGVTVGGDGGSSGSGGAVEVSSFSDIVTAGKHSVGIRAKSVSLAGGNAGVVASGTGVSGGDVNVSVGGSGGDGGASSTATVISRGAITTSGGYATAIEAQSLAGGGGSAKGSISASGLSMGNASVTIGGAGGTGGTANDVSVTSTGALETAGHHAKGILAQSHGGAGGDGGFAAEASFTAGEVSGQLGVTIGGSGGKGGSAGSVSVAAEESITTGDFGATGILAQSIGGNGGNGGNVYTGNLSFSTDGSAQVDVDVGGAGGDGAKAGKVTISNAAEISTDGFFADGINAQSIGGNGGNGGNAYSIIGGLSTSATANVQVDVGGGGGTGATAEAVEIVNRGNVTTAKGGSNAVRAQSLGGGGGNGGSAANINLSLSPSAPEGDSVNVNVGISVGGAGGSGNDGAEASITNSGLIVTTGTTSKGLVAHSVGGGGGDGGAASSASVSFAGICKLATAGTSYSCSSAENPEESTTVSAALTVVVGGNGAGGGDGGQATLKNDGGILTSGKVAHALVAHSHGGGGGNGGEGDLGLAGWTTNSTAESIDKLSMAFTTLPSFTNISAAVGGQGGAAGDGGAIVASNSGDVATLGDHAFAMHLQSVGGGGGNGGAGSSGLWSVATVGGLGSGGGDGGEITVDHAGFIATDGEGAIGIFAQSVGGGGGTAGDVEKGFTASWADLNIGVGVGVQENAGAGGDGGEITVTTSGAIETRGTRAHGLVLQSVGGSGGGVGISGALSSVNIDNFMGNAGDAGNSGAISVTVGDSITVTGEEAHGIFAQSASGTGGGDTSGKITIDVNADVTASGEKGRGILAQSASGDGSNAAIEITIAEGVTVETAAEGHETIGLFDGADNKIVNQGSLLQEGGSDATGHVIRTNGTAALTVENSGLIEGSVRTRLSSGSQAASAKATGLAAAASSLKGITFMNLAGATFGLGSEVDLGGSAGLLSNAGRISAGGVGVIGTSAVSGTVDQSAGGTTWVDFAFGGGHDLITIADSTGSSFAGQVVPNPLSGLPGDGDSAVFDILSSSSAIDATSLSVASTATVDYGLSETTNSKGEVVVRLSYDVDYTPWNGSAAAQAKVPDSLRSIISDNHTNFGDSLDGMIALQSPRSDDFVEELTYFLLNTENVGDLVDAYDRFAPAEIFAASDAAFFSSLRFTDNLHSCARQEEGGQVVFTQQGSCVWVQASGGGIDRQRTNDSVDYDESLFGFSAGGQTALGNGFFAGLAFGYEDSSLSNSRFSGDGSRFQGGLVVKKEVQATTLAASLSGGIASYDLSRQVITPRGTTVADSSPNTNWISAHARVDHVFDMTEAVYLKPWFDVGLDHQWQAGYAETGAGRYGLDIASFSQTLVTLNPMLEVGSSFEVFGAQANASAAAGLLAVVAGRDRSTDVSLLGLGSGGPRYQVSDQARPLFADVGASLDLVVHERAVVSLGGQALLAGNQQEYGGSGRISIFF
ncbi:MAG: hypothetical protein Kilf2KO_09830 [Rhodospirillales bacterium]